MKQLNNTHGSILHVREVLLLQSAETAQLQQRSVGRPASVDLLPCREYMEDVVHQHRLTEDLLFLQHCRSALERAVDKGGSRLVWRWQSGERTEVRFRRQNHHMTMLVRQRQAA